jgi:hypothetical protein
MLHSCRGVGQPGPDPSLRLPPLASGVGSGSRGPASACASPFHRWRGVGQPGPGLSLRLPFARQARSGGARALGRWAMAGHGPSGKAQLTKLEVAPA